MLPGAEIFSESLAICSYSQNSYYIVKNIFDGEHRSEVVHVCIYSDIGTHDAWVIKIRDFDKWSEIKINGNDFPVNSNE
jgi:hypothetical protein